GHYNPEFLDWVEDRIVPDRTDPWFKGVSQLVYDAQIGPLARALYHSHEILFATPERYQAFESRYQAVKQDYLGKLARRQTNESRFDLGGGPFSFGEIRTRYQKRIADKSADVGDALSDDVRWLSDYLATDKADDWYLANTA